MSDLLRDLKYSARLLQKRPTFALIAIVSLALGIGANTLIFSLVNELFIKALPVEEPGEVAAVFATDERIPGMMQMSHLNWVDLRDQNEVFEDYAGYAFAPLSVVSGSRDPVFQFGLLVSGNYFDTLGVRAVHGRTFQPDEDLVPGERPVAVVGHTFFERQLGGDPGVVGKELSVNGRSFTIVGVLPEGFQGINVGVEPGVYIPFAMNAAILPDAELNWFDERRGLFINGVGRLRTGTDLDAARANITVVGERLGEAYPDDNDGRNFDLMPVNEASIVPQVRGGLVAGTTMLMATVGLVLLIACVNVANLLLARATERRREIAMRLALGVSRARLVRQLLTESVMVALLGGTLGIALAFLGRKTLLALLPALPFGGNLTLKLAFDLPVLLFTLTLAVLTGLLFGLVPAIQSSKPELVAALKDQDAGGGGAQRFNLRNALVVAQLALSLVALLGAGLFLRSMTAAQQLDLGFDPDSLVAITHDVGLAGYDQARGEGFHQQVIERVEALPGVERAALATAGPLQGSIMRSVLMPGADSDQERTFVQVNTVGPGYFETVGIPVVDGRPFSAIDRADAQPAVIVNETMAERFWPNESAVGKTFRFFGQDEMVVVGTAKDIKYNTPGEDPQPYAYRPLGQSYATTMTLIARTEREPESVIASLEQEMRAMDPALPLINVSTVPDLLSAALFAPRFAAGFLSILGGLALVLAAIGIYGVMSYAVSRRQRELGIRVALGADRNEILGLVFKQGLALTTVGLVLGLVIAFASTRLLASLLFVSPTDPVAFIGTAVVLLAVASAAVLVPALHAMRLDPIRVLRAD